MFDRLKELLFGEAKGKPKGRTYNFELPYTIKAAYLFYGVAQLKQEGVFQQLPEDLQRKMQRALDLWHNLKVTQEDLDEIPTASWTAIANKLGLSWSE